MWVPTSHSPSGFPIQPLLCPQKSWLTGLSLASRSPGSGHGGAWAVPGTRQQALRAYLVFLVL